MKSIERHQAKTAWLQRCVPSALQGLTAAPLAGLALLLAVGCGPPPKPASLIRLESLRSQPFTQEIQTRQPGSWSDSDKYYRQAYESWRSSDMDEAEDYTVLATTFYQIAEARTKKQQIDEQYREDTRRIEVSTEQDRYYTEEVAKLQGRVAELTTSLSTADQQARAALIAAARSAQAAAGPRPEEAIAAQQRLEQVRASLTATEEVRANLYAAGRYNKARNLIARAEQELQAGDPAAAGATLTEAETEVGAARAEATPKFEELEAKRKLTELTQQLTTAAQQIGEAEVRQEPRGLVVVLHDLFPAGSKATLREERFLALDQVVKLMADFATLPVTIEGHVDASGAKPARQTLSDAFATRVRDYALQKGIDGGRLTTQGYADSMPVEENRTAAGRSRNRRVEIVFKLR